MKEYGIKKSWTKLVHIPKTSDMFRAGFMDDWIFQNGVVMMSLEREELKKVSEYYESPFNIVYERVRFNVLH